MKLQRIGIAALMAGVAFAAPRPATAAFTFTLIEDVSGVSGSGSGSINTAALQLSSIGGFTSAIQAESAFLVARTPLVRFETYSGISGPTNFGLGGGFVATSGSGHFYLWGSANRVGVPEFYKSGDPFSATVSFAGATFASLGVTPGTYVYTWGSGDTADTLTLQIGATAVPEPVSALLFGAGLLGLVATRRRAR